MARHQRGIARLDIAAVVACLALAAVIAVPRHTQLASDTRRAEVGALARNAQNAVRLAHSRWLAEGRPPALASERGVVAISNGYPSVGTLELALAEPETMPFLYDGGEWQHEAVPGSRRCGVSYTPPLVSDTSPTLTPHLEGC